MKYRAKIYIETREGAAHITTKKCEDRKDAEQFLTWIPVAIEQATGGHIEQCVDGIGWVVCEEDVE